MKIRKMLVALALTIMWTFPAYAASEEIRTVLDVWGRAVEIPAEVKTIVCLGSGAPRMAAYLNAVGMMISKVLVICMTSS